VFAFGIDQLHTAGGTLCATQQIAIGWKGMHFATFAFALSHHLHVGWKNHFEVSTEPVLTPKETAH
jgi:hypothetical protein